MKYNPNIHHRRSTRLKGYDYSSEGAYFITICTQDMECLFGEIVEGKMVLNDVGRIVEGEWLKTLIIRKNVVLDEFIVMPDHMHGIIVITDARRGDSVNRPDVPVNRPDNDLAEYTGRATHRVARTLVAGSVGAIIGQFKSITTKQVNRLRNSSVISIWQRNYYEEIIRNEKQLNETRKYIIDNPIEWEREKKNSIYLKNS